VPLNTMALASKRISTGQHPAIGEPPPWLRTMPFGTPVVPEE